MDCKPARLLCPQDVPGQKTGVGVHFLLQGIFPTGERSLEPGSSVLQADSLPSESPRKPPEPMFLTNQRAWQLLTDTPGG